jgi:hypothetical protein
MKIENFENMRKWLIKIVRMREIRMEKRERENNGGGEIEKEGIQGERNSERQME